MKKKFKMDELQCANCAAKMEAEIKNIAGVTDANMNFIMQKLTIEAEENSFDKILEEAERICDRLEPGIRIVK